MQTIFISYAREDRDAALSLYRLLKEQELSPWIDIKNLLPGQEWEVEIDRAIRASSIFIACLSTSSVTKRGYIQSEFRKALKVLETIPEDQVFLIPIRLDDCEVPQKLTHLHWVDYFSEGSARLVYAITQYLNAEVKVTAPSEATGRMQISGKDSDSTNSSYNKAKALEMILDTLSTKRAFFSGDKRILDDAQSYSQDFEDMWSMLGYRDATRAEVTAWSFADVAADIKITLTLLSSTYDGHLKGLISKLIVFCKDYSEHYGKRGASPLGHIGWGDNSQFDVPNNRYGFSSRDNLEIYRTFLEYLSSSCKDLVVIRETAKDMVEYIGQNEPLLLLRCRQIKSNIEGGLEEIKAAQHILKRTAEIMNDVINTSPDHTQRVSLLRNRAEGEEGKIAYLLWSSIGR